MDKHQGGVFKSTECYANSFPEPIVQRERAITKTIFNLVVITESESSVSATIPILINTTDMDAGQENKNGC